MDSIKSKGTNSESYFSRFSRKWLGHFEAASRSDSLASTRPGNLRADGRSSRKVGPNACALATIKFLELHREPRRTINRGLRVKQRTVSSAKARLSSISCCLDRLW